MSKDEIKPAHDSIKRIGIVGQGQVSKSLGQVLSERIEPKKDVVVIDDNTFDVLGEKYTLKQPPKMSRGASKMAMLAQMMGAGMVYGMMGGMSGPKVKPLHEPSKWLIDEYIKVQRKESNLSRSERDRVEQSFNKHFKKITE